MGFLKDFYDMSMGLLLGANWKEVDTISKEIQTKVKKRTASKQFFKGVVHEQELNQDQRFPKRWTSANQQNPWMTMIFNSMFVVVVLYCVSFFLAVNIFQNQFLLSFSFANTFLFFLS